MGRWSRTVTVPDRVDASQVAASFASGILTITLPKAEAARPRHIAVTAGADVAEPEPTDRSRPQDPTREPR